MPASPDRFLLDFHGQGQYTKEHVVNDLLWRKSKVFCECLCGAVQRSLSRGFLAFGVAIIGHGAVADWSQSSNTPLSTFEPNRGSPSKSFWRLEILPKSTKRGPYQNRFGWRGW